MEINVMMMPDIIYQISSLITEMGMPGPRIVWDDIITEARRTPRTRWGSTWKAWIQVSSIHYQVSLRFPDNDVLFADHLLTLIKMFPDKPWDKYSIAAAPNTSLECLKVLSMENNGNVIRNINISIHDLLDDIPAALQKYKYSEDSFGTIMSQRHDVTWDIIKQYPNIRWNWHVLSYNKNIPFQAVLEAPDTPWDIVVMSLHVSWDIICAYSDYEWDYNLVARNKNITWDIIKANSNLISNTRHVSRNRNITWDIVMSNQDYTWYWGYILHHINIPWEEVESYLSSGKFMNGYAPFQAILQYAEELSKNPNIPAKIIMEHPMFELYRSNICRHKDFTWKIVANNPDYPWDWTEIGN